LCSSRRCRAASSAIEDQADAVFALEAAEGDPETDRRRLRTIKFRHDEEPAPLWISIGRHAGRLQLRVAEPFETVDGVPSMHGYELLANRISGYSPQIELDGGWSRREIAVALGVDNHNAMLPRALAALIDRGWTREGSGRASKYHPPGTNACTHPPTGTGACIRPTRGSRTLPGARSSTTTGGVRRAVKPPQDIPAVVTVPALLSVATVARLLDCSPRTVRRRIAEGSLPAIVDHGRVMIRGDDLRAYIDRLDRVGAAPVRNTRPPAREYEFLRH
jgi:excisionase family DNA binding protein